MPVFYSRYIKNANPAPGAAADDGKAKGRGKSKSKSMGFVWHSGIGASGKKAKNAKNEQSGKASSFKQDTNKKVGWKKAKAKSVRFSTVEVNPFHFDWDLADEVFFTRPELKVMGQNRFDDAAMLRTQRGVEIKDGATATADDAAIDTKPTRTVAEILATALDDEDKDDDVSIRGIEHFVYPELQQEMIRRKKEVQKEVMTFVRAKRPDPQGWRLAAHSRSFSLWAHNVAQQKALKYYMHNAAADPEAAIPEREKKRCEDELDNSRRSMRASRAARRGRRFQGSNSFAGFTAGATQSFDVLASRAEIMSGTKLIGGLKGINEEEKPEVKEEKKPEIKEADKPEIKVVDKPEKGEDQPEKEEVKPEKEEVKLEKVEDTPAKGEYNDFLKFIQSDKHGLDSSIGSIGSQRSGLGTGEA